MGTHLQSTSSTSEHRPSGQIKIETLRLDVWLWRARFYKSRAISARTLRLGRIRLLRDRQTIKVSKPHTLIRAGDTLVFMRNQELIHIDILSIGTRRGPAPEARSLYCPVLSETNTCMTA